MVKFLALNEMSISIYRQDNTHQIKDRTTFLSRYEDNFFFIYKLNYYLLFLPMYYFICSQTVKDSFGKRIYFDGQSIT